MSTICYCMYTENYPLITIIVRNHVCSNLTLSLMKMKQLYENRQLLLIELLYRKKWCMFQITYILIVYFNTIYCTVSVFYVCFIFCISSAVCIRTIMPSLIHMYVYVCILYIFVNIVVDLMCRMAYWSLK